MQWWVRLSNIAMRIALYSNMSLTSILPFLILLPSHGLIQALAFPSYWFKYPVHFMLQSSSHPRVQSTFLLSQLYTEIHIHTYPLLWLAESEEFTIEIIPPALHAQITLARGNDHSVTNTRRAYKQQAFNIWKTKILNSIYIPIALNSPFLLIVVDSYL